jgi:hypothetical protein
VLIGNDLREVASASTREFGLKFVQISGNCDKLRHRKVRNCGAFIDIMRIAEFSPESSPWVPPRPRNLTTGTITRCLPCRPLRVVGHLPKLEMMQLPAHAVAPGSPPKLHFSFSKAQLAVFIFLIALIYAASPQGWPSYFALKPDGEISRVALTLAGQGDFAHPYNSLPTGPTAHAAPAYVFLIALIAKVLGVGLAGALTLWLLNICFLALQLGLLPLLSERMGIGALPGVLAAILGAVVQPYRVLPEWESLFTGAMLVILCILTLSYLKAPRGWQHSILLGGLWGVAVLANPECVLLLLAWSGIAALGNSDVKTAVQARRAVAVVLAGAALACMPWFIRNYQQFHAVFFVRDNFGLELYTSNNPCATPTLLENITSGCHSQTHPNPNQSIAMEVVEKGEVRFNRERLRMALAWISSNPKAFAWLSARRFLKFWFPYLTRLRYAVPTGILTILSLAGLAMMFRSHRQGAWVLCSTLLIYPFLHYFVQFEARYRYPIFWATLLPAAYAMLEIIRRLRHVPSDISLPAKENKLSQNEVEFVVRKKGLEPLRPFGHQLLRLARLPIPPLPRGGTV